MTATTLTGADAEVQFAELLERHRGIVFKVERSRLLHAFIDRLRE